MQGKITNLKTENTTQDNSITNLQTATTNQSYANSVTTIANDLQTNGLQSSKPIIINNLITDVMGNANSYVKIGNFIINGLINSIPTLNISRLLYTTSYTLVYEGLFLQIKKNIDNSLIFSSGNISTYNGEILLATLQNNSLIYNVETVLNSINLELIELEPFVIYDVFISGSYATNSLLTTPVDPNYLQCKYNLNSNLSTITFSIDDENISNNISGYLLADKIINNKIQCNEVLTNSILCLGNDLQIKAQNSITLGNSGTEPATIVLQAKAIATNIRNAVAGVWLYNGGGGSYDIYPLFYSTPNLNNHLNQGSTSGSAGFTRQDGNLSSAGQWVSSTLVNINDRFMLLPRFGIIGYANNSYGGAILLNYKNKTSNPVMVRGSSQNSIDSVKIYFNDALQQNL